MVRKSCVESQSASEQWGTKHREYTEAHKLQKYVLQVLYGGRGKWQMADRKIVQDWYI